MNSPKTVRHREDQHEQHGQQQCHDPQDQIRGGQDEPKAGSFDSSELQSLISSPLRDTTNLNLPMNVHQSTKGTLKS
jgi:hypothetical protein